MFRSEIRARDIALPLLTLALAATARASDDDFVGLGGHIVTSFSSGADQAAVLSYGAQVRLRPFRKFGAEASIGFRREDFSDGDVEATAYPVQASFLFFILTGRLDVYALGGATYLIVDVKDTITGESGSRKIPGTHLGAGAQLKLYGPWHVHADVRYLFASDDFEGHTLDYDGALINAGISYWW
ncbi:MAG: outer membrane beta-barrel protein [Acidobacteriota bacterium]